jgi:hypothetical protein
MVSPSIVSAYVDEVHQLGFAFRSTNLDLHFRFKTFFSGAQIVHTSSFFSGAQIEKKSSAVCVFRSISIRAC